MVIDDDVAANEQSVYRGPPGGRLYTVFERDELAARPPKSMSLKEFLTYAGYVQSNGDPWAWLSPHAQFPRPENLPSTSALSK